MVEDADAPRNGRRCAEVEFSCAPSRGQRRWSVSSFQTAFVAHFIGSPAMNLLHARLQRSNGSLTAELGSLSFELPARALPASVEDEVILGIRPEHLADASSSRAPGTAGRCSRRR
jgi:ABC-type sugar transport system ATPase subunit